MRHPIRLYDPQYLHEITLRINGGDYLLDMNSRQLRSLLLGALAKYATKYCIKVIAFHFLSNHYHGLFCIPSAPMFVRFLTAFHSTMATIINKQRQKSARVWGENQWFPVTPDPTTVAERIRYIMFQAVAANLADHPIQFAGPSSNDWMIDGTPVLGEVVDATRKYRDAQLKEGPKPDEAYVKVVEVPMVPPTCWEELTSAQLREAYRSLADDGARVTLRELREPQAELPAPELLNAPEAPVAAPECPGSQGPRPCQPHEINIESLLAALERRFRAEKVSILNRVDALGRPYSPGKVKPKDRQPRAKKQIWILSADAQLREEYGRLYLELVDVYRAAKSAWRGAARQASDGMRAEGFQLPPHTLTGSMPLVD